MENIQSMEDMGQSNADINFPTTQPMGLPVNVDPATIAAAEAVRARIQSAYIMAMQRPRNQADSRNRILLACGRTEFARRAIYNRKQGKKLVSGKWVDNFITGPSIRFAELALREWRNVLSEVQTLYEDGDTRRVRVSVLDLETNTQFTKDLQIKRTIERKSKFGREGDVVGERANSEGKTVYILRATDEEMYIKEAAWVSRILRNEGLRLIPTDLIEEGLAVAKKTAATKMYMDPEGEKKNLFDAFAKMGVQPSEIEKYLGHSVDIITPSELVNLRAVYESIKEGELTWFDYISDAHPVPPPKEKYTLEEFKNLVIDKEKSWPTHMDEFIGICCDHYKVSKSEFMEDSSKDFSSFMDRYRKWSGFRESQNETLPKPKIAPGESSRAEEKHQQPAEVKPQAPAPKPTEQVPAGEKTYVHVGPESIDAKSTTDAPPPDEQPAGNWWDNPKHWKFRRARMFKLIVAAGFGFEKVGQDDQADYEKLCIDNPDAFGTLVDAGDPAKKELRGKYDTAFGKGALNAVLLHFRSGAKSLEDPKPPETEPQDSLGLTPAVKEYDGADLPGETLGNKSDGTGQQLVQIQNDEPELYKNALANIGANATNTELLRECNRLLDVEMDMGMGGPPAA